jgi:hypothetical protein
MSTHLLLRQYTSCAVWLESFRSKSTINVHSMHLSLICNRVTRDQLVQSHNSEVLDYIIHLKKMAKQTAGKPTKGELSVNSIKFYLTGMKSFLDYNEVTLLWKKIGKFYPNDVKTRSIYIMHILKVKTRFTSLLLLLNFWLALTNIYRLIHTT